MRKLSMTLALFLAAVFAGAQAHNIYDFTMKSIDGQPVSLKDYSGKVVMLVNVASKCGFTPQYAGLEKLYEKYKDRGFVIVGVPANNFAQQEPGTNDEIKKFCSNKYNVTFPMMSKIVVKGEGIDPLYKYLTSVDTKPQPKGDITWNFEKFLIGKDGHVVGRFKLGTKPEDPKLVSAVEAELKK